MLKKQWWHGKAACLPRRFPSIHSKFPILQLLDFRKVDFSAFRKADCDFRPAFRRAFLLLFLARQPGLGCVRPLLGTTGFPLFPIFLPHEEIDASPRRSRRPLPRFQTALSPCELRPDGRLLPGQPARPEHRRLRFPVLPRCIAPTYRGRQLHEKAGGRGDPPRRCVPDLRHAENQFFAATD